MLEDFLCSVPIYFGNQIVKKSLDRMQPRIAVLGGRITHWTGGLDLLAAIVSALESAIDDPRKITLLLPRDTWLSCSRRLFGPLCRLVRDLAVLRRPRLCAYHTVDQQTVLKRFDNQSATGRVRFFDDSPRGLKQALQAAEAQVLLPVLTPSTLTADLPWVAYIPDLQHRHCPEYFDAHERRLRDRQFGELLARAPSVMATSRAVAADLIEFYPMHAGRIFTLPFAPTLRPEAFVADPPATADKYGITRPFFLISNQFWRHKGHALAFRALARVRAAGWSELELVCTGDTHDYRFPTFFAELHRLARHLGIAEHLRILGRIPKSDQMALMRGSLAVIQPTEFEGVPGGGAVFDAVALGVPALVSNIPVNLELESERGIRFFDSGCVDSLAGQLFAFRHARIDRPDAAALQASALPRRRRLGAALIQTAQHALCQRAA